MFAAVAGLLWLAGELTQGAEGEYGWSPALFFCVIVAYITPVFHFITLRTEEALDELSAQLSMSPEQVKALRRGISYKTTAWTAINLAAGAGLWLLQIWLLAGSFGAVWNLLSSSLSGFVAALVPLVVWLTMTCAIVSLVDNARLFRRLSKNIHVDLLDIQSLNPFGRMAVSSTLMIIGAQASVSIMWLDGKADPWTTIPGMILTSAAMLYLFVAPVLPIHRSLKVAKISELARLQELINNRNRRTEGDYAGVAPLLAYRREIIGTREWPFDLSVMARLGLYIVIVPLTWIGAALIERAVDLFVS